MQALSGPQPLWVTNMMGAVSAIGSEFDAIVSSHLATAFDGHGAGATCGATAAITPAHSVSNRGLAAKKTS
jgi:hypothetical protein